MTYEQVTPTKQKYVAPKLTAHGTVATLTRGTTNGGCPSELVDVLLPGLPGTECEPR